jgi:hypothetical protein
MYNSFSCVSYIKTVHKMFGIAVKDDVNLILELELQECTNFSDDSLD